MQSADWRFVVGIEGDWDYFGSKPTFTNPNGVLTTTDTVTITQSLKTSSLATIRPRLGIVTDRTFIYATGGAAFARVSYTQTYADTLNAATGGATGSTTLVGWTVGGRLGMGVDRPSDRQDRISLRQISDHQRPGRHSRYRRRSQCTARLLRSDDPDGPSRPELPVLTMTRTSRPQSHERARRHDAAAHFAKPIGANMITHLQTCVSASVRRCLAFLAALVITLGPIFAFTSAPALACACGCSVFDVGFGGFPQEDDHGGRVFYEWDHSNQNPELDWRIERLRRRQSRQERPYRLALDRLPVHVQPRLGHFGKIALCGSLRSRPRIPIRLMLNTFQARDIGDLEIMGMYTGFSKDMSTGLMFGLKLPTGAYTGPGFDRDTQIGTGSTDLILGAFHRGMITGDNAWQYFAQVRLLLPFAYRAALSPDTGNYDVYKPAAQVDGSAGIVYNNGYNILGFDKITPILQLIASHRERDTGPRRTRSIQGSTG